MKNTKRKLMAAAILILTIITPMGFDASAGTAPKIVKKTFNIIDKGINGYDIFTSAQSEEPVKEVAKEIAKTGIRMAAEAAAIPTAVSAASAMGVTASTGTAIATLSGAAATNATLAAIGGPVATVLSTVGVTAFAPVAIGTVVVVGAAGCVGWGINSLLFD